MTLDGIDAEDSEDGIRPDADWTEGSRKYNGYKYGDLPTTYVLGDNVPYMQASNDISVDMGKLLDFDKEFPESERFLNNPMAKWVRRIRETQINRQIFPVYTSMEGMDVDVHDLTIDDMKGITFQIVPQFYWKYEWSYNNYMIHPVGQLESSSSKYELYDMLGNVWELVRDDWNESLIELTGKSNPVVGTSTDNENQKKVIKGGAFNQLVRNVISPSREDISQNSSKSRNSEQSNVGFRPSLTFTSENSGGNFTPGRDPVDLFFLFDASASQDNQVSEMLESANEIVKMFSGDSSNRDLCHVGSGLFLGSNIHLMCSAQCDVRKQVIWDDIQNENTIWGTKKLDEPEGYPEWFGIGSSKAGDFYKDTQSQNKTPYDWRLWNFPYHGTAHHQMGKVIYFSGLKEEHIYKKLNPSRGDWIQSHNPRGLLSGKGMNGKTTGLNVRFKDYKDNVWMQGVEAGTRAPLLMSRDGPGGGGGGSSTGSGVSSTGRVSYPVGHYIEHVMQNWTKKMYIHCGVPAWKDSGGQVHFGEIDFDSSQFNGENEEWWRYFAPLKNVAKSSLDFAKIRFSQKYTFFTYDPTEAGVKTFVFPFIRNAWDVPSYQGMTDSYTV